MMHTKQATTPPSPATRAPTPAPDFAERRRRALEAARRVPGPIDALIVSDPHDIHYLTGVHEGIFWLALSDQSPVGISRHMLRAEVQAVAPDCEILLATERSTERPQMELFVITELANRGLTTAVFDPARLSTSSYLELTRHAAVAGIALHPLPDLLANQRAVKDDWEIHLTRRCVTIAEQALAELISGGADSLIGRTERDIVNELDSRMRALGAERQAFPGTDIIVASGPNSASAHHSSGERKVGPDEALLIDWGAEISSYRSDSTRTLFIGSIPDFAIDAYPVVQEALNLAANALRAGAVTGEIDRLARETVTSAGYDEFHYGVGHGVGLQIHEAPWIRAHATELLQTNMLTTIEPGIYLPGIGGIRLENIFRVTDDGHEPLGTLPTNLESMIIQ
jgi:Xaa-Pro aminopeptidase